MEWTFKDLLTFAASAGVISAVVSQALAFVPDWFSMRRRARILSMKTAVEFDAFFHSCVNAIGDIDTFVSSDGHQGQMKIHISTPPDLSKDDEAWTFIKPKLMARAFKFAPWVKYENEGISADAYHEFPDPDPTRGIAAQYDAAERAYILSKDMPGAYKIPEFLHSKQSYDWLLESKARFQKRRIEREALEQIARAKALPISI